MMDIYIGLLISLLGAGIVLCLYRIITGPTLAERAVASDGVIAMVMGILILISIREGTDLYINAVLIIALLGFIGTLTVARYLEISDHDR